MTETITLTLSEDEIKTIEKAAAYLNMELEEFILNAVLDECEFVEIDMTVPETPVPQIILRM